jgi:hypothetical protein
MSMIDHLRVAPKTTNHELSHENASNGLKSLETAQSVRHIGGAKR